MNERFFSLPKEKQKAILNAGYRVFSQNSYKNSPMSEIAQDAGISKSLLFHYFYNSNFAHRFSLCTLKIQYWQLFSYLNSYAMLLEAVSSVKQVPCS